MSAEKFVEKEEQRRISYAEREYKKKIGNMEEKCSSCDLGNVHNEKPLILQLEHIDGDHHNNDPSNLTLLCPNCHSQTDTWCGRNVDKPKKEVVQNKCECGANILQVSTRCPSCAARDSNRANRKVKDRPSLETLNEMKKTMTMVAIGKHFGVSDNSIRKWIKQYENDIEKQRL